MLSAFLPCFLISNFNSGYLECAAHAEADEGGEGDGNWSCDFVGSYHGLQPTRGSFSADGSLLAVSFSEVITLWSPDTWELLSTLCLPPGDVR